MKSNSGPLAFAQARRVTLQIEGLESQQVHARDLFIEKVGMTMFDATHLVLAIGPARSAELREFLQGCTGNVTETLAKLFTWQPRRPH